MTARVALWVAAFHAAQAITWAILHHPWLHHMYGG